MKIVTAILMLMLTFGSAIAKEAAPLAEDEAVEARLIGIAEEMRCLVCQNESLAGSHAELAEDLRREIRAQIKQGKSDQDVMDFMVTRYGDFVRYRPPVKPITWLLWFGPFILLVIGIAALVAFLLRRGRNIQETPLSDADHQRAAALLAEDGKQRTANGGEK
ncbi:MAG: cytochrome c-type biogenesis protein [Sulfuricellaceae bacterium]